MRTPVLIDTDMGVDDAVAIALALAHPGIELTGLVSVGGNVPLEQATRNIGRLLAGIKVERWPAIARGLDQDDHRLLNASHVFGADGLGEIDAAAPEPLPAENYLPLYQQIIAAHGDKLVIVAIGPLTNLAAVLREDPGLLRKAGRIIIMGGAIWCPGNVTLHAEFNFYRDPAAASGVLASGLPITLVTLDVTRQVGMDASHIAHLSRSGTRAGELLARMMRFPMEHGKEAGSGKFLIHDALALGILIWPELFMQCRMGLQITLEGEEAGKCKPVMSRDKSRQIAAVVSVNVTDFLENLLETLCQERFVV